MTEVIKLKRRVSGGRLVIGVSPLITGNSGIASGECVWDSIASIMYIGAGDNGSGFSTTIVAITNAIPALGYVNLHALCGGI